MLYKLVVYIQYFASSMGLGMDNDIDHRSQSAKQAQQIKSKFHIRSFFSLCFLSISRLSFSTFSSCTLASCFASRMSRYNMPSIGSISATKTTAAIHPTRSSSNDLRTGTTSTGTGGRVKSLADTLTFLASFFLTPPVAMLCIAPLPLASV